MRVIKIGTWNISECVSATWNLSDGSGINQADGASGLLLRANEIVDRINYEVPDIVCFQEFPVFTGYELSLKDLITNRTELKYCVQVDTCPSFLFSGGKIGVALFSKYEISEYKISYFIKPDLSFYNKKGKLIEPFDKGIITSYINVDGLSFAIVTGHAIGFAPFNAIAENYPESYMPLLDAIVDAKKKVDSLFLIGDFNTEKLTTILPDLDNILIDRLEGPTTPKGEMEGHFFANGRKLDYFMTTPDVDVINIRKINNFSDHFFCVCTCFFKEN